jgi:hypothetical protein
VSVSRITICDCCGKTKKEKEYTIQPGWFTLWGSSKKVKEDLSYDLCSMKCVKEKIKKLK